MSDLSNYYKKSKYSVYVRFLRKDVSVKEYELRELNACFVFDFNPQNGTDFDQHQEYFVRYFREDENIKECREYDSTAYYKAQILYMANDKEDMRVHIKNNWDLRNTTKRVLWPNITHKLTDPHPPFTGDTNKQRKTTTHTATSAIDRVKAAQKEKKESKKNEAKSMKSNFQLLVTEARSKQDVASSAKSERPNAGETTTRELNTNDTKQQLKRYEEEIQSHKRKISDLESDKIYYKERVQKLESKYEKLEESLEREQKYSRDLQSKFIDLYEKGNIGGTSSQSPLGGTSSQSRFNPGSSQKQPGTQSKSETVDVLEALNKNTPMDDPMSEDEATCDKMLTSDDNGSQEADDKDDDGEVLVVKRKTHTQRISSSPEPEGTEDAVGHVEQSDDETQDEEPIVTSSKLDKLKKFGISMKKAWVVTSDEEEDEPTDYPPFLEKKKDPTDPTGKTFQIHVGKGVWIAAEAWRATYKIKAQDDRLWARRMSKAIRGKSISKYSFIGKVTKTCNLPALPINERRVLKALFKVRLLTRNPSLKNTTELYNNISQLSGWFLSAASDQRKEDKKLEAARQ